jgi:hypothetical protein
VEYQVKMAHSVLPKTLSILMETLASHNNISSWNIYQNNDNATCITIRFSDSHASPFEFPVKYRKISDKQMSRNRKRVETFRLTKLPTNHNDIHIKNDENCEMNSSKKRKTDNMSPENFRIDTPVSPIGPTLDTPVSVLDPEHNISLRSPDGHSSESPTLVKPHTYHHDPLYENSVHVEYEHTDVLLPPLTYAIEGVEPNSGEFYQATTHPAIQIHENPSAIPTPIISDNVISENCGSVEIPLPPLSVIRCPCCDCPMDVGHTCDQPDDTSSPIDGISMLFDMRTGSLSPPTPSAMHTQPTRSNPIIPRAPKPPDPIHMPRAYKYFMSLQQHQQS